MPELPPSAVAGPVLFARYAYPPNSHGYCGPNDHTAFFQQGMAGDDRGLRAMSQQFAGAWPYLELIAGSLGLNDPLDPRVVNAYWVGSPELDRVSTRAVGNSMDERFRFRAGPGFGHLTESVLAGGVPHHSFAVFCIYPWTGLLSEGRKAEHALTVLDQCRIRWGKVLAVQGDQVVVESTPLTWDGHLLGFGEPRSESVTRSVDGVGMATPFEIGDWVSMHWEWVCDRLTEGQVRHLRDFTVRHLRIVNEGNLHSGPAALLGT
ncbi:MAG: uncharacterized protein JWR35_321 [Marmoricola sp.]|nr:uncharacterized protein [Marmoricola sp.]